jgi:hypothetical protein
MESTSSNDNEHKPKKKSRFIPGYVDFPAGEFNPLIEKCFGHRLANSYLEELVFDDIFPLYQQFLTMTKKGWAITTRDSFIEKNPPLLELKSDLRPIKKYLSKSTKKHFSFDFRVSSDFFEVLLNLSYSKEEIIKMSDMGVKRRYLSEGILNFATAYHYWCLSNIANGKRIGCVGYCRNGNPNVYGDFFELDTMQQFIPAYDKLKAYSFSERDFLINDSEEEVGDRLVNLLSDFRREYKTSNLHVLVKMAKQIKEYGKRLEWNPSEFFKNVGWKYIV